MIRSSGSEFAFQAFVVKNCTAMFRFAVLSLAISAVLAESYIDDLYMHKDIFKSAKATGEEPEPPEYWTESAQNTLKDKLEETQIIGQAKNVIMFLGDGFGIPTLTLARILKGQERDNVTFGEEGQLHMDTFPHLGFSRTFCSNSQVADSACSATAYLCGVKANAGTIGVTSHVPRHNCTMQQDAKNHVSSILAWAQAASKSTGVVTTTRITHASPSGTYAHVANRDWESDTDLLISLQDPTKCDDIAEQLILSETGRNINVIMGGGRRKFLPFGYKDSEGDFGERVDGKNLIQTWKDSKPTTVNATYVEKLDELLNVDASKTDYLMGLFSTDHLAYYHEQERNLDPSLAVMTEKAIEVLSKNPNGFFLFVEGGRIDHAHHDNRALRSIWEAVEFDSAIKKGDDLTNDEDTLIVVTADHSHAFTFAGYADRGTRITDFGGDGDDNLKYSTMNYANGPGYHRFTNDQRHNISQDDIHNLTYRQVPLVKLLSETHGGEDVAIFAKGPFSHLLTGAQLQNYIPHVMGYASCVGSGLTYCNTGGSFKTTEV